MNRTAWLLLASALAAGPSMTAPQPPGAPSSPARSDALAAALAAGRAAYAGREDPGRLAEAIARFGEAAALRPADPGALLPLVRALAFRALSTGGGAPAWREAGAAAERALRAASPEWGQAIDAGEEPRRAAGRVGAAGAEPLYFLGASAMGMAQARGMAAVLAVREEARAMVARAAELDERVDHAGPRRALGAWLATLPSAAGGGAAAARAELDRARSLAPAYQLTRVRDAEVLAVLLQDRRRFEALLAEVLASDDAAAPEIAPENRLAKRLARELLARKERLF